jgi:hypothetical protein
MEANTMSNFIFNGNVPTEKTTQQIKIEGDIKIRMIVLGIIGCMLIIITFGGILGLVLNEAVFGKYWSGLLSIISGTIFGFVGFIAGQKSSHE